MLQQTVLPRPCSRSLRERSLPTQPRHNLARFLSHTRPSAHASGADQLPQLDCDVVIVGAGQGYIWLAHRLPSGPAWDLALLSSHMWRDMVAHDEMLASAVEWQTTGSLLLAANQAETDSLLQRAKHLRSHGITSQHFADSAAVTAVEPSLALPAAGSALLVETDSQINGRKAAVALFQQCQANARFIGLMDEPVTGLDLDGLVPIVRTAQRRVSGRLGTVVVAGVWTGELLATATGDRRWRHALSPRRGHLLELAVPAGMPPLQRGVMEVPYTKHYDQAATPPQASPGAAYMVPASPDLPALQSAPSTAVAFTAPSTAVDITFTATTSAGGNLLVGSSREFAGWDVEPSGSVVAAIIQRAASFMPHLEAVDAKDWEHDETRFWSACTGLPSDDSSPSGGGGSSCADPTKAPVRQRGAGGAAVSVRVGLRPFASGGLPIIGPVASVRGLFVAAGHEGSGLCLGPATAELLVQQLVGSNDHNGLGTAGYAGFTSVSTSLLPSTRLNSAAPQCHRS